MDIFMWIIVGLVATAAGILTRKFAQNQIERSVRSEVRQNDPRIIRRR